MISSRKARVSRKTKVPIDRINEVLNEMRPYWPLTLRQVYYRLFAGGDIKENIINEYQRLSRQLSEARYSGQVDWNAIEDRSRRYLEMMTWANEVSYYNDELENFLTGYHRDLLLNQPVHIEVWLEKDALAEIVRRTASRYCVPVVVGRGFVSTSFMHECRQRVKHFAARGKPTQIIYLGDFDPSGWEMFDDIMRRLQDEMELGDLVSGERCALTYELVRKYQLANNPKALKSTDSRASKFVRQFGRVAVELDALTPSVLAELIQNAIEAHLDLNVFNEDVDVEAGEQRRVAVMREHMVPMMVDRMNNFMEGSNDDQDQD